MKRLIILPLLLLTLSLGATRVYVATTGDDGTGDGTSGNPYLTIQAGINAASPGDTVFVSAGTYNTSSRIVLPGGISLMGEGDVSHIITTYVATGISDAAILLNSPIANPVNGNQSISYIKIDGSSLTATRAVVINFRSNVKIHHCTVVNFNYSGITFDSHNTDWNVDGTVTRATGNELHDCILTNNSGDGSPTAGNFRIEGQNGFLGYNNTIDQTGRAAGNNADSFAGYFNEGYKIHDNIFIRNDSEAGDWNFFFELHYNRGGCEIYRNRFIGAATADFSGSIKGSYAFGGRIYENLFTSKTGASPVAVNHDGPALDLESFDYENDIYVYRNLFNSVRIGVFLNNCQTSAENIYIYYNMFVNIGHTADNWAFGIAVQSDAGPMTNINILNNTITCAAEGFAAVMILMVENITGIQVQNNIMTGNWEDRILRVDLISGAPTITNLLFNNNVYSGATLSGYDAGITYTDRNDSGNINTNPLFKSNETFRLRPTSPAIDEGIDVGLTTDYWGHRIPQGSAPDIGATEYGYYVLFYNGKQLY